MKREIVLVEMQIEYLDDMQNVNWSSQSLFHFHSSRHYSSYWVYFLSRTIDQMWYLGLSENLSGTFKSRSCSVVKEYFSYSPFPSGLAMRVVCYCQFEKLLRSMSKLTAALTLSATLRPDFSSSAPAPRRWYSGSIAMMTSPTNHQPR